MAALITSLIPQQNFESVRNAIGAILAVEMANQYTLYEGTSPAPAFPYPNINKCYVERIVPYDLKELPAINVSVDSAEWSYQSIVKRDGVVTFNIDIDVSSTGAPSSMSGNQFSGYLMQKIAGLVAAILSNQVYLSGGGPVGPLGFPPGFIGYVLIKRLMVMERSELMTDDNLSTVRGRIQVDVKILENNFGNSANPVPLSTVMSKVLLTDDEFGFLIEITGLS